MQPRPYAPYRRPEPAAPAKPPLGDRWEISPSVGLGFLQRNTTSSNHGLTQDYGTTDEKTAEGAVSTKYVMPSKRAPGENLTIGLNTRGKYGDVENSGTTYKFESSSLDEGNIAATSTDKPNTSSFYGDITLSPEVAVPLDSNFQIRFFSDLGNRFDKLKSANKTQNLSAGGELQFKTTSGFRVTGKASQRQITYPAGPVPKGPLTSTTLELRLFQSVTDSISLNGGVVRTEQRLPAGQVLAAPAYGSEATTKFDVGGNLKGPFGLELGLSGSYAQLINYTVTDMVHPTRKNAADESLIVNVTAQGTKVGYLGELKFAPVDWVNAKISYEYASTTFSVPDPELTPAFQKITPNFSTVSIYAVNLVKKF